jgi:hypothetical protein
MWSLGRTGENKKRREQAKRQNQAERDFTRKPKNIVEDGRSILRETYATERSV